MADATKRALAEAVARAEARSAGVEPVEQFELLPPTKFDAVDEPTKHAAMVSAVKRDRAGRPPGAQNLATRDALEFVRKVIGDPLIDRARVAMHTPETLAKELGCTVLEAFDRLDKIRADLAGYFYAKKAAVDDQGQPVAPRLTMVIGGHAAPGSPVAPDGRPPWEYLDAVNGNTEQNQQLKDVTPAQSHGDQSHEDE